MGTVIGEMTARGRDHIPSGPAQGTVRERTRPIGHKNNSITLSRKRNSAHPIDANALTVNLLVILLTKRKKVPKPTILHGFSNCFVLLYIVVIVTVAL